MSNRTAQPLFSQSSGHGKLPPPDERDSALTGVIALFASAFALLLFLVPLYPQILAGAGIVLGKSRIKRLKQHCDREDLQTIAGQMMADQIMKRGKVARAAIQLGWFVLFISMLALAIQLSLLSGYQNSNKVQSTKIIHRD